MLTSYEMTQVEGGKVNYNLIGVIGTLLTFLAGVIDGYMRPLRCN